MTLQAESPELPTTPESACPDVIAMGYAPRYASCVLTLLLYPAPAARSVGVMHAVICRPHHSFNQGD
jgi:hypothetical protein